MQINPHTKITILPPAFVSMANKILKDTSLEASEFVALVYRDPNLSIEEDNCNPVEIHFDSLGNILSVSSPEFEFSFEHDQFRQLESTQNLAYGRGLLGLHLANLTALYKSGVYEVEVIQL